MSSVPVTITGMLYDLTAKTSQRVVLMGEFSRSDLSVGGGPITPDIPPPDKPPHIWGGGNEPFPTPPIANVPPISNPNPPDWPNRPPGGQPPTMVKPPPPEGGWAYTPQWGWGYYPGTSNPGPK